MERPEAIRSGFRLPSPWADHAGTPPRWVLRSVRWSVVDWSSRLRELASTFWSSSASSREVSYSSPEPRKSVGCSVSISA